MEKCIFNELVGGQTPSFGAEAEWRAIKVFQKIGIPTIEPFYMQSGVSFFDHRSLLISKALEKKVSLEHFSTSNPVFKRQLIKKIAEISRKMHLAGINHRDFYLCHFLMDQDISKGLSVAFNRSSSCPRKRKVPRRWLIKDLGGLLFLLC